MSPPEHAHTSNAVVRAGHSNLLIGAIAAIAIIALTVTGVYISKEIRDNRHAVARIEANQQRVANDETNSSEDLRCTEHWVSELNRYFLNLQARDALRTRALRDLALLLVHQGPHPQVERAIRVLEIDDDAYLRALAASHYPQFHCADSLSAPAPRLSQPAVRTPRSPKPKPSQTPHALGPAPTQTITIHSTTTEQRTKTVTTHETTTRTECFLPAVKVRIACP